jgi:hypothetical protein
MMMPWKRRKKVCWQARGDDLGQLGKILLGGPAIMVGMADHMVGVHGMGEMKEMSSQLSKVGKHGC